jgi:TolB-like protein/Tfp pilus assembly protein PilF
VLELRLLGEPEIYRDGERVEPLPPRKTVALLAYLTATGRRHRRERLCSIFFELPGDPRAALRWSLTKLRQVVDEPGDKRIVADRESVTFEPGRARVDLYDIRTAVVQGLAGVPTQELERLAELFRGAFIEGTDLPNCQDFQAWCVSEREEVQTAQSQILSELVKRLQDNPRKALPYARALVDIAADRKQAETLVNKLRAADGEPPSLSGEKPSIAVLPFQNISGDPEQDYLADGITEDIITALARCRWLQVVARTSAFAYKGQSMDARRLSAELGARYILEGSVRKSDSRVRVTAQVVDGRDGTQLWGERYDRDLEDVFALQDEIAAVIVGTIEPELEMLEGAKLRGRPAVDLNAWDCYQRGLWHLYHFKPEELETAQKLFERAISLDGNFAQAYARLAYVHIQLGWYGHHERKVERLNDAISLARKAVKLDARDPAARLSLGRALILSGAIERGIEELRAVIELDPNFAQGHFALAQALCYQDRHEEALPEINEALRLSPRDPHLWTFLNVRALIHYGAGNLEQAAADERAALRQPNATHWPVMVLAAVLGRLGKSAEAQEAVAELDRLRPGMTCTDAKLECYFGNHPFMTQQFIDQFVDDIRKAGLPE